MNSQTASYYRDGIDALIENYQGFLLDQWGVLHDGTHLFPGVIPALEALRAAAKPVVVISNSGKRAAANQRRLARIGIDPALYSHVVTSGEVAWFGLKEKRDELFADLGRRCLFFSRGGDRSAIDGLAVEAVDSAASADFVLLSGLDPQPRAIAWVAAELARARERELVLLCSNPDINSIGADGLEPAPGALARDYADAGGEVRYIGKPWPTIYRAALARIDLPPERVLAVGDSLAHDVKGAAGLGIDAALVTGGVHREDFAGATSPAAVLASLKPLTAQAGAAPRWVLPGLRLNPGNVEIRTDV